VQAVAHEPADREVDLRLAHQTPVMDQAEQEADQHQPNARLGVNAWPAVVGTVEISHLIPQPRQIEHAIHTGEDVIVGHKLAPRYTTLLRAVELWGAVRADGPGRLAGDEELPPVNGLAVCREEDLSQQIKANPEDRLSTAFVGLDDDGPVFRLPFTGRVGERKGHGQHSEKLADPVG